MKKLIVLVALVLIAQTIHSAKAAEIFKGQLIRNLQSNQFEGKKLAILTPDNQVYPLFINSLPEKFKKSLNYTRNQEVEITGELLQPEQENQDSPSIEVKDLKIVDDANVANDIEKSGVLTRANSENYSYLLTTKIKKYKFSAGSKSMDRILKSYLNQVIKVNGEDQGEPDHNYTEECYYDDEYDEYIDEWGEVCDPDEFYDEGHDDYRNDEEGNVFILRSVTLPTKFATQTGRVSRRWQSGGYIYFLTDPVFVNNGDEEDDSIPKTQIWITSTQEESYIEKYNEKVITITGPVFKHKGKEMVHAESIQVIE